MKFKRLVSAVLVSAMILGSALPVSAQERAGESEEGLLLHYDFSKMEGTTVKDSSGNNNDGSMKGTGYQVEDDTLTLPGGDYGSDAAYVELPTGMFDNQDTLSISLWLKNETGAGNYAGMYFGTTEALPTGYWILNPCNPAGNLKSVITDSLDEGAPYNTEAGISPTVAAKGIAGPVTGNAWALYTTVIEPGSLTAYYNGVKIGTVNTNRKVSEFGKDLVAYIGKSSYHDKLYKGSIKDVKVYTRALSDSEVSSEYQTQMQEPLLLHYDFDQVEGTTVKDVSGNGNDGVIKGEGYQVSDGEIIFPGGAAGSNAAYMELPRGMFDGQDTLTISLWLKNETQKGNLAAMYFGTESTSHYWIMNPGTGTGMLKSVITKNSYNGEYGFSPTNGGNGLLGPATSGRYALYTTVIEPGRLTVYYNGKNCGTVNTGVSVSEFGTSLSAYIAKSPYPDMFFKGKIKDVKVYREALPTHEIISTFYEEAEDQTLAKSALEEDKEALEIAEKETASDITLPVWGENGSAITWTSSNPEYVKEDGSVVRPSEKDGDVTVTLTAKLALGKEKAAKEFQIKILCDSPENNFKVALADYDLGQSAVAEDIVLPSSLDGGISLSWKSSEPSVITDDGKVSRPESGEGSKAATLTMTAKLNGMTQTKEFKVEVIEKPYGNILTYVRTGNTARTDALHYAYSKDGSAYTALNNNHPVLYLERRGEKKMGSPVLFRKADGAYGLLASDDNNSTEIVVYDSEDLIYFTNPRTLSLNSQGVKVQNPSCRYDSASAGYIISYEGSDGNSYEVKTKDFVTVDEPVKSNYKKAAVSGTLPQGAMEAGVFEVTKEEYDRILLKWQRVVNTDVTQPEDITVEKGAVFDESLLAEKATANYSDGSAKEFGIQWNQDEIAKIDTSKPGTYQVTGTLNQPEYEDVLVDQRADPWAYKGDDGYYYFTGTYPICGAEEEAQGIGNDRIPLRRAKTLQGLRNAEEVTIWHADDCAETYRYIWAPEIHQINGKWYIFFTASVEQANPFNIRPHVLECVGDDPMDRNSWKIHQMQAVEGDTFAVQQFSLDMTHFESAGQHYVVWAANPGDFSNLYIATIDPEKPWQLTSEATKVTKPDYAWENPINEGPAVIKNNGNIYLCFSAAAINYTYCVGMLSAKEGDDLLDINSWTKYPVSLLSTDDLVNQCGPGHNSFTTDENGNPVIVYHARPVKECSNGGTWDGTFGKCEYVEPGGNAFYDPCRHARVKSVNFAIDGTPILNMTPEEELKPENKTVTVNVVVKSGTGPELPYVDVAKDAWYYDAVAYNYEKKTMTGLDNTHFGPADTLVRAQFAAVLHKMNAQPEMKYTDKFPDVIETDWFKDPVLWAAENKIVTGYTGTGMFGPNDPVTRAQMATMMYRYAKDYKGYEVTADGDYSSFPDAGDVQEFAVDAMKWAVAEGIITGKTFEGQPEGKLFLDPQGSANRAECATIIQRFMEKYEK